MIHATRFHPLLAVLLCLALIMVRVGGAHLHLCFDGTEPPASYHAFDDSVHHELPDVSVMHQDADVALSGVMYSKPGKSAGDLYVLLFAIALAWTAPAASPLALSTSPAPNLFCARASAPVFARSTTAHFPLTSSHVFCRKASSSDATA